MNNHLEKLLDKIYNNLADVKEMKEFNQLLDEYIAQTEECLSNELTWMERFGILTIVEKQVYNHLSI